MKPKRGSKYLSPRTCNGAKGNITGQIVKTSVARFPQHQFHELRQGSNSESHWCWRWTLNLVNFKLDFNKLDNFHVIVATLALEIEEHIPHQHDVTLIAADRSHSTTPVAVGRVIFEQLSIGPHQLRFMASKPSPSTSTFPLIGTMSCGVQVDSCKYFIRAWNEDDHAAILKFNHHVRVVIEDLLIQFWSLLGAEKALEDIGRIDRLNSRTLERGHTKTFACWLWVWDVAHISTRRALCVMKCGIGRFDEIVGIALDDRRAPLPPGARRYDMLIHADLLED
ncbi:uncharacterized protein LOC119303025 [Triticum dicoccoides]|uniref:uncharacterized protein LOC119303025 n=1 Tax=Triticum dicoccoides TaxID=85692 RepID=UPI00188F8326|nr:uncharacterized protein LOC119303025 [Triticum dicoccoides]XP_037436002.1 uncharacterized protein LOC119303025 [Triticum dicoccoides]